MGKHTDPPAKRALKPERTTRWLLSLGSLALVLIGLGLLVLMTHATGNRENYNQNYEWLVLLNTIVAGGLVMSILWGAGKLLLGLRRGQFGARLLGKLAGIFALVGVIPGVLIYVVSYQFVSRSIESWFDVRVETALVSGLNLARATLDAMSDELSKQTRLAAEQLVDVNDADANEVLEKLRHQIRVSDAILWSASGRMIARAGPPGQKNTSERAPLSQISEAHQKGGVAWVEGVDEAPLGGSKARIKTMVMLRKTGAVQSEESRLLQINQDLPATLVSNALEVQSAYRAYQERFLAREGLRRMYIGTLTLSLFLAVLGAILLAVILGNQLARPLLLLAHGMRQVASGDLAPKLTLQSKDELGGLTRSFADMTQQLLEARTHEQRSRAQLETARGNLQTILDNLTAGVMVLDANGAIQSSNPGAIRILRVPITTQQAQSLLDFPSLKIFSQSVTEQFGMLTQDLGAHELDHWQKSFEIHSTGSGLTQSAVTILARGALLPDGMRLLVFDDISDIVSAERAQAWGEVARRLAHEIKNPLTPIQLSAERLERKLSEKLVQQDDALLRKSVKTIVDQVNAMKRLVNEFRDYARLPSADLKPIQLNTLVSEVMVLYTHDPAEQNPNVPVITQLDPACPPILGDEHQLRQVIHNLLQNAQDACETKGFFVPDPRVMLCTEWSTSRNKVRLTITDTGPGFEANILQRAFEPYVTTKAKGTGLGLAVVKKIADEHAAKIELSNVVQDGVINGAQVSLSFARVSTGNNIYRPT